MFPLLSQHLLLIALASLLFYIGQGSILETWLPFFSFFTVKSVKKKKKNKTKKPLLMRLICNAYSHSFGGSQKYWWINCCASQSRSTWDPCQISVAWGTIKALFFFPFPRYLCQKEFAKEPKSSSVYGFYSWWKMQDH